MDPNCLEPAHPEDDFYTILGCAESSTVEQIMTEYRIRALKCHPDKHPDNEECLVQFQRLQEAKEVLCDPTKRKDYDRWRSGALSMSWKQWNAFRNSANPVWHWAVPKTDGRMLNCSEGTANQRQQSNRPAQPTHAKYWESDRSSLFIRKFRNYEI